MFIILRSVHFFSNGFEKNLSFIDKFMTISSSRFEIFQKKIQKKIIKFNSDKIKINFVTLIKNKYFKFLFSLKYVKNKKKKFSKSIFYMLLNLNSYIQYLNFINYSIYIDIDIDIVDDRRYNKLNKIFKLLELDYKNLTENLTGNLTEGLTEEKTKKTKNKIIRYVSKHFKNKKKLTFVLNTKQNLFKKVIKNHVCYFIIDTNICDKTGIFSNISTKTYSLYNNIYNILKFNLNSLKNELNLNKIRKNVFVNYKIKLNLKVDYIYSNILNLIDIFYILPFKYIESKSILFCLSIFFELMFLCFSYIAFFKIEFSNIIQTCLDIIHLYKLEFFSFLEFMCIQTLNKDYFNYQLQILSIIKQFLNDKNFLINFFLKYYNSYSVDITKYIYLYNFSEIIEIFKSSYHTNLFLNSMNSSINLIKNSFKDFNKINNIYPANLNLNLNYYLKNFICIFNKVYIKPLLYHTTQVIQIIDENVNLIRQTPLSIKASIETLSETIQNVSKRGRPRKLSFYQKGILIEEGVIESEKHLNKNVLYEFIQENSEYTKNISKNISNYVSKRDKNHFKKEQKSSFNKIIYGENYYINTNNKKFAEGPIIFSQESINAALAFASELMEEFNTQNL